jgi:hypothetical protein
MARGVYAARRRLELIAGAAALVACNGILGIKDYGPRPAGSAAAGSGGTGETASGGSGEMPAGGSGDTSGEAGTGAEPGSGGSSARGGTGGSGARGGSSRGGTSASGGTNVTGPGGASGEAGATNGGAGAGSTCTDTLCSEQCVDLQTDPHDCGACGHDCQGGECSAGQCQSVTLATDKGRLMMVVVDGTHVYYGGDGVDVRRVNTDGTGDVALAPAGSTTEASEWTYDWALAPGAVLWGNDWVHLGVRGCATPDCAGGPKTYEDGLSSIHALAFNATHGVVFFDDGSTLRAASWPVGAPGDFATGQGSIVEATSAGEFVYWASCSSTTSCDVRAHEVVGGETADLVTNWDTQPFGMSAGGGYLFLSGSGSVFATPLPGGSGGSAPKLVGTAGVDARKVFATSENVYWAVTAGNSVPGAIVSCPVSGCDGADPQVVVTTTPKPWGVTVAAGVLYWVSESGEVGKLAL